MAFQGESVCVVSGVQAAHHPHHSRSLDVGKYADLAGVEVADYREIPYYFGVKLCRRTMKHEVTIHTKKM
jgi:imidazolonepropionase-like amidohydrolase